MVLVDTTIWIDFFQNPESVVNNEKLEGLIRDNNRAVICGIILQEILQGIRDERSYALTKERLCRLPFINTDKETYLLASDIYRTLRSKGITIPPVDITISAAAVLNNIPLFTRDKHFKVISKHSELRLF